MTIHMRLRTIRTHTPRGKRVLYRTDYNVPLGRGASGWRVANDLRLRKTLPTLRRLLASRNRVIILTHLGRPEGKPEAKYSLAPVAQRLQRLLGKPVAFVPDCVGPTVTDAVEQMVPGSILLLENLRFHPGEKKNDTRFARQLAKLGDLYVNDAFGNAHRADASVSAITRHLPSFAGLLLDEEVRTLAKLLAKPARPFVAIVGGGKIEDKLGTIRRLLPRVDALLLGGALANTVLLAKGIQVGRSRIDRAGLAHLRSLDLTDTRIHLPVDVVVSHTKTVFRRVERVAVGGVPPRAYIYDIGPDTAALFASVIARARTVLWAGPLGCFEEPQFLRGTAQVARAVARSRAWSVVGGGDTVSAIAQTGTLNHISFVSTGGGAMLEFLAGKSLPALRPLIA